MKKIIKLLHVVVNLGLTTALLLSISLLVYTTVSPNKKISILKVLSGSMEPKIHTGSIVIVETVDPKNLLKGDVISYTLPNDNNTTVTHRIVDIKSKGKTTTFTTKGDANNIPDLDEITFDRIKGKVIISLPFLGYFLSWIKQPQGFLITVIIPAIFIIINEVLKIKKSIETSAIEKYKKKNSNPPSTVLLLCCLISLSFIGLDETNSYFSSGKLLSKNTFATNSWSPTASPTPTSTASPEITPLPTISPSPTP